MLHNLCMPALIYLIYATTRIILDVYKGLYNSAFVQVWIAMLFTYLLNILCRAGLGIISWLVVSIPFILMSTIAGILLFVFGLNPATGKAMYAPQVQFATSITTAQDGHSPATLSNQYQQPPPPPPPQPSTAEPQPSTAAPTSSPQQVSSTEMVSRAQYASPISVQVESFRGILGRGPRPNFF